MQQWESKFDSLALSRGKTLWKDGKVEDIRRREADVSAAVSGIPRYDVTFTERDGMPIRLKCQCPKYRRGSNCEHMAAVLYAIYGDSNAAAEAAEKAAREREDAARAAKRKAALLEMARKNAEAEAEAARKRAAAEAEAARKRAAVEAEEARKRAAAEAEAAAKRAAEEEEARRKAVEEEAAREQRRQEVAAYIAAREAEKKAKKAERKKKRQEAELAEAARRQEELRRQEEEARQAELARLEAERVKREEQARKEEQQRQEQLARQEAQARKIEQAKREAKARQEVQKVNQRSGREEGYRYFQFDNIREEQRLTANALKKGEDLYYKGQIHVDELQQRYLDHENGEMVIHVHGTGKERNTEFDVELLFGRNKVYSYRCDCAQCEGGYGWYYSRRDCPYIVGLLKASEDYVLKHSIGEATNREGSRMLYSFRKKHVNHVIAESTVQDKQMILEPRVQRYEEDLRLSFRVGAGKLFVIKDLIEFCRLVRNSENAVYGSNTELNHSLDNFTEQSRVWYEFISKAVKEEEELARRLEEEMGYYTKNRKCSYLRLYGWRLDQFYQMLSGESVIYEDKTGAAKDKKQLAAKDADPSVTMKIDKIRWKGDKQFHGIKGSCRLPMLFHGMDTAYFVDGDHLCRVREEFMRSIEPLEKWAVEGLVTFQIGRNSLSEFYYEVLPAVAEYVEVQENDAEEIRSYLPPEVQFVFYLDAENGNMTCRVGAKYGEKEVLAFDVLDTSKDVVLEPYRMDNKEEEILFLVQRIFPHMDGEEGFLHCDGDEEVMYQVLEHGVADLMELGEVQCTQRFRNMNVVRRVKMNVGVSVSNGLLNLDIATQDISREELLDILRSYRTNKRFYRLKNGDFLNMEDDSLKMLSEMMEALHLSPKEFVKGNMHLPAYRTLYLDKLLEENEAVYSTRDSHFKEMAKNFKTVSDADFEEPSSLSQIMRSYQKNGFKWLKTLESYGFGGILADDMGLGKTLQVIAVLLAAYERRQGGVSAAVGSRAGEAADENVRNSVSLVVAPASLVYNWAEEFQKFAPVLKVLAITGTQESRHEKLQNYQDYDVLVTSYDLLKRDIAYYEDKQFDYQIIDEAQYIKNHTTAASKAVKVIKSRIKFALTGTPIENRLSELWSIFDYLMPGFLYGYDVFRREMETPIAKNGDEDAMKRLQKMTAPFILRRLKKDVLKDLPDKLEEIRYVQMEEIQQRAYDAQVVHMQAYLGGQDADDFNKSKLQLLAELTKLRQICCDPSLCFSNYRGESAKLEACLELIQSAMDGGHKILLFSQFTSMLDILQASLDKMGISYYVITGATPKEKRLQMVKSFNEDETPLFLVSLKAGGVGLNLTGADVVIHYDPWWNLAVQEQATDRAHRIGQTKKVTVYKLIARHTVEEKIQKLQETKRDLADSIVNAQTGQFAAMSKEEFLELLEA